MARGTLVAAALLPGIVPLAGCSSGIIRPRCPRPRRRPRAPRSKPRLAQQRRRVIKRSASLQHPRLGLRPGRPFEQALADFDKAISLDTKYAQAYANRGLVHRQTRKLDLALADYNKALALDPAYAAALLGRGLVHRQRGQLILALNDFNKAIAIRPDNAQAYYNRGVLYQGQNQHQFAIDDFSIAITLSPQQAEPLTARGGYLAVNDAKAAVGDLDEAVQVEPQGLAAWVARGLAYERLGEKEKAAAPTPRRSTSSATTSPRARVFSGRQPIRENLPDVLRAHKSRILSAA